MPRKKNKPVEQNAKPSPLKAYFSSVNTLANGTLLLCCALLLAAAAVFLYYPNHGGDYDVWWHLKYGEHFVQNFTWDVDHTAFSWTPADSSWQYVSWIGSSCMYLIYRAAGFAGLHAMQYLILLSVGLLLWIYLRISKAAFTVGHGMLLLLVAVAINPTAVFIKPELFTVVFFGLLVLLYFIAKDSSTNLFWALPLLFLVWENTHGAFVIGLFFISMVLVLEWGNYLLIGKNAMNRRLLLMFTLFTGLSFAALIINPKGISYPAGLIVKMAVGGTGERSFLTAYINRWQYLFPDIYVFRRTNTAWAYCAMMSSLAAVFFYAYRKKKFLDSTLIIVSAVFFLFGMQMARASLYFPLIWIFTMQYVLRKISAETLFRKTAAASVAVIVLVSSVCIYNSLTMNSYYSWFGSKINEQVPAEASAFIRDNELPGPIFNDYLSGGYLIWSLYPEYGVFIDPRHVPFIKTDVWNDFMVFRGRRDETTLDLLTEKYQFRTAFIHHINYGDLAAVFMNSEDWRLVFFDAVAAVFVRESETGRLGAAVGEVDFGAQRFVDLADPVALFSLFKLYSLFDIENAREIMHIYNRNVKNFFSAKGQHLNAMNSIQAGK